MERIIIIKENTIENHELIMMEIVEDGVITLETEITWYGACEIKMKHATISITPMKNHIKTVLKYS